MRIFILLIILSLFNTNLHAEEVDQQKFRSLVNLSNYIANDYVNAVAFDTIINKFEYAEMQEFAVTMKVLHEDLSSSLNNEQFLGIQFQLDSLDLAIQKKKDASLIEEMANDISHTLLAQNILNNTPSIYPNILAGEKLYLQFCAHCHGDNGLGNGPAARGLEPAPSNFIEAQHISPFHIYNTVQLGIEGTSMIAQNHLSEEETWDLAFYVMTLTYQDSLRESSLYQEASSQVNLTQIANLNNQKLAEEFSSNGFEKVKALRFHSGELTKNESLALTLTMLRNSMDLYHSGNSEDATQMALDAYFIGFEPVEIQLGATSPGKVQLIEKEMMVFRSLLSTPNKDSLIREQYEKITYHFDLIAKEKDESSFWFVLIASFSILIREGLEALFVIVAILAALNSFSEGSNAKKYVHGGWLSAVFIGLVAYFFVGKLITMGAHKRELIEGFGALLAVVILLAVGFWLHGKSNAKSWSKYIKTKLSKHFNSNSLWSIALLSFVVVFREAFESVIFLSSLSMAGGSESGLAVLFGALLSMVFIGILGIFIVKFSKRLPVHQVFKISSITMLILAVILAGKGINELQEAAFIGVDLLNFRFSIDFLGFYPTYQTIIAQIVTLTIAGGLWLLNRQKHVKLNKG
ncbi:MAG: cytochrome c/FTR1 family iron permease [Chitinophagales bacterium]|nr:cytochrome c/FTR1 family iron permease [Chitinophagales bacterium]